MAEYPRTAASSLPAPVVNYNFDIYTLPLSATNVDKSQERRLTDGKSFNFDGHFFSSDKGPHPISPIHLAYVTEVGGTFSINMDTIFDDQGERGLERVQRRLVFNGVSASGGEVVSKPVVFNDSVIYVSAHPDLGLSSSAVYSTDLTAGSTRRLTPDGHTDFSPAVSPSGVWTAVASYGEGRVLDREVEVEEHDTDIYVFLTRNGSERVRLVQRGAWPSWADDSTLYFHRKSDDGWWSVYKAILPEPARTGSVEVVRITPPGLHAYTPAAVNQTTVAVTTSRADSEFGHIELFDVEANQFAKLTRLVSPDAHHLYPFVSPDGKRVGYHRCRGGGGEESEKDERRLFMERLYRQIYFGGMLPSSSQEGALGIVPDWMGVRRDRGGDPFGLFWDTPVTLPVDDKTLIDRITSAPSSSPVRTKDHLGTISDDEVNLRRFAGRK